MSVWEVEYTDQFGGWFAQLAEEDQDAVIARVELLEARGPALGRPAVDNIQGSRHPNMKELRAEGAIRVLFASIHVALRSCCSAVTRAGVSPAHPSGTTGTPGRCPSLTISTTCICPSCVTKE
jgi:hypothetical protein